MMSSVPSFRHIRRRGRKRIGKVEKVFFLVRREGTWTGNIVCLYFLAILMMQALSFHARSTDLALNTTE